MLENAFLWFLCGLFGSAIVVGLWALLRERGLRKKPGAVRLRPHPCHVGSPGSGVSLKCRREGSTVVIRTATSYYVFLLGGRFLFGPGLTILCLRMPEIIDAALPIALLLGMFASFAWIAFLTIAWTFAIRRPRIDIDAQGIRLLRGSEQVATIPRADLASLQEEITSYPGENYDEPNYGLYAVTKTGRRESLWIVSDLTLHEQAKAEIEEALGPPPLQPALTPPTDQALAPRRNRRMV